MMQGRIQDSAKGGSSKINVRKAREIFKPRPLFVDHAHFRSQTACSKLSVAFDGTRNRSETLLGELLSESSCC